MLKVATLLFYHGHYEFPLILVSSSCWLGVSYAVARLTMVCYSVNSATGRWSAISHRMLSCLMSDGYTLICWLPGATISGVLVT